MYGPPFDPRNRPPDDQPSWRGIVTGYAVVAAFFLLLWSASHPLAGVVVLAAVAALVVGARRSSKLVRCFYDCGGFTVDLGGTARITISRTRIDDSNDVDASNDGSVCACFPRRSHAESYDRSCDDLQI